jgi:hypothetical protein
VAGHRFVKLAFILAAAALACSNGEDDGGNGTGGPANEPSSAEQLQTLCTAQCARSARCSASDAGVLVEDASQCDSTCDAELGTLAGKVRADAVAVIAECFDSLACGVNDDGCLNQALQLVGATAETPIVMQCLTKEDQCQGTPGDFLDDICATLALLIESEKAAASRCLERPCDEVPSCLAPYGA